MPSVDDSRDLWDRSYDWKHGGDEWSAPWGGVLAQWRTSILPRLASFLPTRTLLEIAPGFGRWSQFLAANCERYIGVDLAEICVVACTARFAGIAHAEFHVNNGRSLEVVADDSVDVAFSFDSLVHAEADVIGAYLEGLARKFTRDGVGVLHHSNIGECEIAQSGFGRAESMTASRFVEMSSASGLVCVGQEIISWPGYDGLVDCISVVTRGGSRWDRQLVVQRNPGFVDEARSSSAIASVFSSFGQS